MNRRDLIKSLATRMNTSEVDAGRFIDSFAGIVRDTLSDGGDITLLGFGRFHCKKQRARIGRNPNTGESIAIPARFIPAFAPGKQLKEALHQPGQESA